MMTNNIELKTKVPQDLSFLAPHRVSPMLRLGRSRDGGYAIPLQAILSTEVLISMGLSDDWSFDQEFSTKKGGIEIHGYDHTVSEMLFIKNFFIVLLRALIFQKGIRSIRHRLGVIKNYRKFWRGKNIHFKEKIVLSDGKTNTATLLKVIERTSKRKVFLKIDIEGSEYGLSDQIISLKENIIGMVVEYHETQKNREKLISDIRKLEPFFKIVHLHANNATGLSSDGFPLTVEITFLRQDFVTGQERIYQLPIVDLDLPNDPLRQDFQIVF